MARKKDRRNGPPVTKTVVNNDQSESYEGDDEGKDEESPPISPTPTKTTEENKKSQKAKQTPEAKKTKQIVEEIAITAVETDPKENEPPKRGRKKGKRNSKRKEDEEYEVEQIVGMDVNPRWRCPVRFRVRWVGFGEKDDTWVPVDNLSCDNFVQDFLQISARKTEFEKAMERTRRVPEVNPAFEGYKNSLRRSNNRVGYSELDSDDDEFLNFSLNTRTRNARPPDMFDPSEARPQLLKRDKPIKAKPQQQQPQPEPPAKTPPVGKSVVSRAQANLQQAGREYEVVMIVDHRVRGRFTEYKVRWKGLSSAHDSWVPEADLTCPKLIASYHKTLGTETPAEQEYDVAAIIDSREIDGIISYKVRWRGFSTKFDSWLPKDEMNCPDMIEKFEAALEKLNKKEDWVVAKITKRRERGGVTEFLVHWSGFESKYDTWEPEQNLEACQDKLDDFFARMEAKKHALHKVDTGDDDVNTTGDDKAQKRKRPSYAGSDDEEDEDSEADEEISMKNNKKKKSNKTTPKKTVAPLPQQTGRLRRASLPVSYEEQDEED